MKKPINPNVKVHLIRGALYLLLLLAVSLIPFALAQSRGRATTKPLSRTIPVFDDASGVTHAAQASTGKVGAS
ncbi:MAG: hypothetical protein WBW33_17365, partial [Bryobacteraceae bacterium]